MTPPATFVPPTTPGAPLSEWVRPVPDWPQPGVLFRDLTPLWADGGAWARCVSALARPFDAEPPELVLGIEARGFLVAAALAARWGAGILLARKPGKLPGVTHREDYQLEYGTAAIESHRGIVRPGRNVLVADDVLATGGTAFAALELARGLELLPVGFAFVVEIEPLGGRARLDDLLPTHAVITYDAAGGARVSA
ncbi:MAG: adenine phosphoribosyltransferase [Candidatus Eisenbacteria bacterium]